MCRKQIGYKDIQDISSKDGLLRVNKEFSLSIYNDGTYDISYIYGSEWMIEHNLSFDKAKDYLIKTLNINEVQADKYLNQADFKFI